MSDDDLVAVLEQVHEGRFQLPAAPSLSTPQPSSDTLPGAVAPSRSTSSFSDSPLALSHVDRQNATGTPGLSSPIQDGQQSEKQAQPAATNPVGKEGTDQQDAATAKSFPDAWQQQTFRLQDFTKPLMQLLQGDAYPLLRRPHSIFCAFLLILTAFPVSLLHKQKISEASKWNCMIRVAGGQTVMSNDPHIC